MQKSISEKIILKKIKPLFQYKISDNVMFYDQLDANKKTISSDITDFIDKIIFYIPYKI
jgi:hypothetical protein